MIKVEKRNYYINEKCVKKVYKKNDLYVAMLDTGEKVEISEDDYYKLGGVVE